MLDYDPKANLQHWPVPLARFGVNPYGETQYRIVLAPSRRMLVYGEWPDGSRKASWVRAYSDVGAIWIMEKWQSAYDFTKCTPETWNDSMTLLGPYPDRGDYTLCWKFDTMLPTDADIERLIGAIEEGKKRHSAQENLNSMRTQIAKDDADQSKHNCDLIRDKFAAYGTRPMASARVSRGSKTQPDLKTAEELGLGRKLTPQMVRRMTPKPTEYQVQLP